jgi:hypothetical protein
VPTPSFLTPCIGLSKNCAFNFNIIAKIWIDTRVLMDMKKTNAHFDEELTMARKNVNSLLDGDIDLQTSTFSSSRKLEIAWTIIKTSRKVLILLYKEAI